jgi:hypothetical protein
MGEIIITKNSKKQRHGYTQFYLHEILWYRGSYKNGKVIGYTEINDGEGAIGDKDTRVLYYIK